MVLVLTVSIGTRRERHGVDTRAVLSAKRRRRGTLLSMEQPRSLLASLPGDEKDELLALVATADEVSSIFLKVTHEQWIDELVAAVHDGDAVVVRSLLETRLAQANEACGELLSEPTIPLDIDALFTES